MRVFLTGAAGFIGFHVGKALLDQGHDVFGYDNLNDYYDPKYKEARLEVLRSYDRFKFKRADLGDRNALREVWDSCDPSHVLHLAAQAGVRYSLENPNAYIESNIVGFQNIIELVRHTKPTNFVYASSSSVYGSNKPPFSESQDVSHPVSLYAASKKANELVAACYNHLFQIPATGLRFFTVYGPYARPDMAMFKFASLMRRGEKIPVYNNGNMIRDFTYVDDIVDGILKSLNKPEAAAVYNLGRGKPMLLSSMIDLLEKELGISCSKEYLPMQPGDVPETVADVSLAIKSIGYEPKTNLDVGVKKFCDWFKSIS